jgi:hypothetical protein
MATFPRSLEESLGQQMLAFVLSNASRKDMLRLVENFNRMNPECQHITIMATHETAAMEDGVSPEEDRYASSNDATMGSRPASLTPTPSRPPSLGTGDDPPEWLGEEGYEVHTHEWLTMRMSQTADTETNTGGCEKADKMTGEDLTAFVEHTIEETKNKLLEILNGYEADLRDAINAGSVGELNLAVEGIVEFAKGKNQKIEHQDVNFPAMMGVQECMLPNNDSRDAAVQHQWWCYFNQLSVTDTEVDEEVLALAKRLCALINESTDGDCFEDEPAKEGTIPAVTENSIEDQENEGDRLRPEYAAYKEVVAEGDARYPKHRQEVLSEASRRSGVEVKVILAEGKEAKALEEAKAKNDSKE